jgi:hypothetical protein
MVYILKCPEGFEWKIADGDASGRWTLLLHRGAMWVKIATYTAPGAAALAVANDDTGVTEWDHAPHDRSVYQLSRWTRQAAV